MKRMMKLIPFLLVCCVSRVALGAQPGVPDAPREAVQKETVVKIDYGDMKPSRIIRIPAVKGKTVLEMLQTAACVETHPVAGYVFVTAIDGVKGKRGETAWYYTIDDNAPGELAYTRLLDGTEGTIQWIYQKDVCSWTVDGKPQPPKE